MLTWPVLALLAFAEPFDSGAPDSRTAFPQGGFAREREQLKQKFAVPQASPQQSARHQLSRCLLELGGKPEGESLRLLGARLELVEESAAKAGDFDTAIAASLTLQCSFRGIDRIEDRLGMLFATTGLRDAAGDQALEYVLSSALRRETPGQARLLLQRLRPVAAADRVPALNFVEEFLSQGRERLKPDEREFLRSRLHRRPRRQYLEELSAARGSWGPFLLALPERKPLQEWQTIPLQRFSDDFDEIRLSVFGLDRVLIDLGAVSVELSPSGRGVVRNAQGKLLYDPVFHRAPVHTTVSRPEEWNSVVLRRDKQTGRVALEIEGAEVVKDLEVSGAKRRRIELKLDASSPAVALKLELD
jgi:hypothetical protein